MVDTTRIRNSKALTVACLSGAAVLVGMLNFQSNSQSFFESSSDPSSLRNANNNKQLAIGAPSLKIPASLDSETQRRLSLNLGGGNCQWEPPEYDVPTDIKFFKTLIAGFPSCDKRMTFTQMEALTGWAARDEWDFVFEGASNHPFIKSNYPHHEGYWSWGTRADQVVLVVRNIRRTMVEYHDILWDIASAKKSNLGYMDVIYNTRAPLAAFLVWRDLRVMEEISWYGWFIDYWMEGGLRRDIMNHELTTPELWPYRWEEPVPPDCLSDPWHVHSTEPNTCTNSGEITPPTPNPTKAPTPLPTVSPTESPTPQPTPNDPLLKVFVSSETYQGDLGGIVGADLKCQALASDAGLPGTFKAWISNSDGTSPSNSFNRGPYGYHTVGLNEIVDSSLDSYQVVNNWDDLIDGTLLRPIDITEQGVFIDSVINETAQVWTATSAVGGLQYFENIDEPFSGLCQDGLGSDWVNTNENITGTVGTIRTEAVGAWTIEQESSCVDYKRLYCFEQYDYNYIPPELPVSVAGLGPGPAPAPIPPPAPIPYLHASANACCTAEFPGEQCFLADICPTPAPTPALVESYDPHCGDGTTGGEISGGCEPVAVISAEKLRDLDPAVGPAETQAIANALAGHPGISEHMIDSSTWECIWEELIPNGKGNRMVQDRPGYVETDYNFSASMLTTMITELTRLITKYQGGAWATKPTAIRLVQLLSEHRDDIQEELDQVSSGQRTLTEHDFLGPEERERRRRLQAEAQGLPVQEISLQEKKKHFEYFLALENKVKGERRKDRARERKLAVEASRKK